MRHNEEDAVPYNQPPYSLFLEGDTGPVHAITSGHAENADRQHFLGQHFGCCRLSPQPTTMSFSPPFPSLSNENRTATALQI